MKAKKSRRSLSERYARKARRKQAQRDAETDEMLRLAAEDVPFRSGIVMFGTGKFNYIKMSNRCGSVRIFRFHDRASAEQAKQIGMMHDTWPDERADSFGRC